MFIRLNFRDGDSTRCFGPNTWLTTMHPPEVISHETMAYAVDGNDVAVGIHGYNVDEALPALSMVYDNLKDAYPVFCALTWPGSKMRLGYWPAEQRADEAGQRLAEAFAGLPYRSLDVQGHSCGCRVALEAVRAGLRVRNLILAAAAVDNESVQVDKKYGAYLQTNCEHVLVAYSHNDAVLKEAFRVSSYLKRLARFKLWGDDCKALGYTGPQNPEKCPSNLEAVELPSITGHSRYKDNRDYFDAWKRLMNQQ